MITPTLYIKTGCPWCEEVLDYLDDQNIDYDKVVVSDDPEAMDEMVEFRDGGLGLIPKLGHSNL